MNRELKAVILTLLTLCIYALYNLIKFGSLIFPFPINSIVFGVILLQFCYWERNRKFALLLPLLISLFAIISSIYFWEILLSLENIIAFDESGWLDLFKLILLLLLAFAGFLAVYKQKSAGFRILSICGLILFIIGGVYDDSLFSAVGLTLLSISVLCEPVYKPFHYLWVLLAGLEISKLITLSLS